MLRQSNADRVGLILSGGGARAAYQVGVLRGIANILPRDTRNPFHIIAGTSAGALNAVALATNAHRLRTGVRLLEYVWKNIRSDDIYVPQSSNLFSGASSLLMSMISNKPNSPPLALLDNEPLAKLISRVIKLKKIQRNIDRGLLDALSITVSAYSTGESVSFYQGVKGLQDWEGPHRIGRRSNILLDHLMASTAIPVLFPPRKIGNQYFGDGAVRQLAPTSTALQLGARRILAIGVSGNRTQAPLQDTESEVPSLSKVLGHILNSAFVDTLENDLDFLRRMNEVLPHVPERIKKHPDFPITEVDLLEISPSKELNLLASNYYDELPKPMSRYIKDNGSGTLLSLVLFEKGFCNALWQLGFEDALNKEKDIKAFFQPG